MLIKMQVHYKATDVFSHPCLFWTLANRVATILNAAGYCTKWTSLVHNGTSSPGTIGGLALRRPMCHSQVPGFDSQFQLLTPASCPCRLWEAAVMAPDARFLLPTWKTWMELLAPGFDTYPPVVVDIWAMIQQIGVLCFNMINSLISLLIIMR